MLHREFNDKGNISGINGVQLNFNNHHVYFPRE